MLRVKLKDPRTTDTEKDSIRRVKEQLHTDHFALPPRLARQHTKKVPWAYSFSDGKKGPQGRHLALQMLLDISQGVHSGLTGITGGICGA